jgi:hypothetical protein
MARLPAVLLLAALPAMAAPVAGPVRGPALPGGAEAAFVAGVAELAPPPAPPPALAEADRARAAGERAYLDGRLPAAERALAKAAACLDHATDLTDAAPCARSVLLLTQVRLALGHRDDARVLLEHALRSLPGFPGDAAPPPALQAQLNAVRASLGPGALGGTLTVRSDPPGAPVRLNGVAMGRTPLALADLPAGPVRVRLEPAAGPRTRLVDLAHGPVTLELSLDEAWDRTALGSSLGRPAAEEGWAAAERLQEGAGAESVCVALAGADGVLLVRLDAPRRAVAWARHLVAPADDTGWRAVGRLCGAAIPGDVPPDRALARLWPQPAPAPRIAEATPGRRLWAWGALGTGTALAGVATVFGMRALSSADDFRSESTATGARRAREDARRQALVCDVSLGVAAALAATGLYLMLADAAQP